VFTTATSIEGVQLVTDLTKDDFEVFDNGRRQPITLFDNSIQAIKIVVMLDMSGSMTGNLSLLRASAVQMFTRLLPADQARVGNFGDRINISPKFTNNQDDLIRAVAGPRARGPTRSGPRSTRPCRCSPARGAAGRARLTDGKDTGFRNGPFGAERAGRTDADAGHRGRRPRRLHGLRDRHVQPRRRRGRGPGTSFGEGPDPGLHARARDRGRYSRSPPTRPSVPPSRGRRRSCTGSTCWATPCPNRMGGGMVDVRTIKPGLSVRARRSFVAGER
jgi:hypothetical protein